ncbi:MAG: hypothetical protein KGH53_02405 [Candidatus Micrarchaeota archaeon]|nr:hypothetical protein [Candidatus Micrarchaeota archaeon]
MSNLRIITPKIENSMAQCSEVFQYMHKKFGMTESLFKDYVRIDSEGEIRVSPPTNRIGNPKLAQAISIPLAVVIIRDRKREKIAEIVNATLPSV